MVIDMCVYQELHEFSPMAKEYAYQRLCRRFEPLRTFALFQESWRRVQNQVSAQRCDNSAHSLFLDISKHSITHEFKYYFRQEIVTGSIQADSIPGEIIREQIGLLTSQDHEVRSVFETTCRLANESLDSRRRFRSKCLGGTPETPGSRTQCDSLQEFADQTVNQVFSDIHRLFDPEIFATRLVVGDCKAIQNFRRFKKHPEKYPAILNFLLVKYIYEHGVSYCLPNGLPVVARIQYNDWFDIDYLLEAICLGGLITSDSNLNRVAEILQMCKTWSGRVMFIRKAECRDNEDKFLRFIEDQCT